MVGAEDLASAFANAHIHSAASACMKSPGGWGAMWMDRVTSPRALLESSSVNFAGRVA